MEAIMLLIVVLLLGAGVGVGAGFGYALYRKHFGAKEHEDAPRGAPSGEVEISDPSGDLEELIHTLADIARAYGGPGNAAVQCIVNDPERMLKEHRHLWRTVALRVLADSGGDDPDARAAGYDTGRLEERREVVNFLTHMAEASLSGRITRGDHLKRGGGVIAGEEP